MRAVIPSLMGLILLASCKTVDPGHSISEAGKGLAGPATEWQAGRQPIPGTIVRIFPGDQGTGHASVVGYDLGALLTPETVDPFSTDIKVTKATEISLTAKFVSALLPSASASFSRTSSIERVVEQATGSAIPVRNTMSNMLDKIEAMPGKSDDLKNLLETVRSQQLSSSISRAGTLYIVTEVSRSPSIKWIINHDGNIGGKFSESAKAASADLSGKHSSSSSNTAVYSGPPKIYSVILRRIGSSGSHIRYNESSQGPSSVDGE